MVQEDELDFNDFLDDKDTFLVKLPNKLKSKLEQNMSLFEMDNNVGKIYRKQKKNRKDREGYDYFRE